MGIIEDFNESFRKVTCFDIKYRTRKDNIVFIVKNCYNQRLEGVEITLIYNNIYRTKETDEKGEAVFSFRKKKPKKFRVKAELGIYKYTEKFERS